MKEVNLHRETIGVIGGYGKEEAIKYKSFPPPLFQTVTYPLGSAEIARKIYDHSDPYQDYVYTRRNNPTNDILEKRMAAVEGGEAGLTTSSGMAATFLIASYLLEQGAECVISNRIYMRSFDLLTKTFNKFGVKTHVVKDPNDLSEWERYVHKRTRFMYLETPSNPGLVIADIKKLASLAKSYDVPLIVDNTIATPAAQKPIELGATVVMESVSKHISGNGTALGGVLVMKKEWADKIRHSEYVNYGMAPSPFNSWLCLLGLETLHLRMLRYTENATKIALFLENHPKVARVNYPGLKSHPQHELARIQMKGLYGALLSFSLKDQKMEKAFTFLDSLKLIVLAIHENANRSIIMHPPSTNFADLTDDEMERAKIAKSLIRLSVGIENVDDLIGDLEQALDKI